MGFRAAAWPAFVSGFIFAAQRSAFAVQYPVIVGTTEWSAPEVGAAFGIRMLTYSVASLMAGAMADRVGVRLTMALGLLVVALASLLSSFAQDFGLFFVEFGICVGVGLSAVGYAPVLKSLALFPARLGYGFGALWLGQGVGTAVASLATDRLLAAGGWQSGQIVMAGAAIVFLPAVLLLRPPGDGTRTAASSLPRSAAALPLVGLLFVSNIFLGYWIVVPTVQIAHLVEHGFSSTAAAEVASIAGILMTGGAIGLGWASHRRNPTLLAIGTVSVVVGTVSLALLQRGDAGLVLAYFIGGGLGRGVLGLAIGVVTARLFPYHRVGLLGGMLEIGVGIGALLGPLTASLWHESSGDYEGALLAAALAALAAGAGAYTVENRRSSAKSEPLTVPTMP